MIAKVACEMFLEYGFDNTSIDELVQRTKISKRTFYNRFKNKADLFSTVCIQLANERYPLDIGHYQENCDLHSMLQEMLLKILDATLKPDAVEFDRMMIAVAIRFPEVTIAVDAVRRRAVQGLREFLAETNREEVLHIEDAEEAAWHLINGAILPPFRRAALGLRDVEITADDKRAISRFVKFFIRGYEPRPDREER
ncbi:TetR/AcrR family transcriptional regulator [Antarcticirhabdus aurantiaca]|uniref:TetR/AcrR family transcriptional regulator n=1 Tax=Antarcticirhabdus aurantiaca TaxID=2606717 RepID=A0ACD4NNH9_9HYPH|nr:TetR/AcrR family transcriptional regulator [Antarcticirhabdus aurantiaca]WAJ28383.1 TetR/AcrR family transcriptional regulator [Jeongeuplla avenae]